VGWSLRVSVYSAAVVCSLAVQLYSAIKHITGTSCVLNEVRLRVAMTARETRLPSLPAQVFDATTKLLLLRSAPLLVITFSSPGSQDLGG